MEAPLLITRLNAGPLIGGGHGMRCLSIAALLKQAGWRCAFAVNGDAPSAVPALAAEDCRIVSDGNEGIAAMRAQWQEGCSVLLVDHYGWSQPEETSLRDWAGRIIVIDDLVNRRHDCDLLIDPTPGAMAADYDQLVPAAVPVLAGPAFALLRAEYYDAGRAVWNHVAASRILVMFGATDPDDWTGRILSALAASSLPDGLAVDVVLGAGAPHRDSVKAALRRVSAETRLHVQPSNLPRLIAAADVVIGAGGGSSLERCYLGLPSVVMVIADNQRRVARGLVESGAAVVVERADEAAATALALLADPSRLRSMGMAARRLCDGLGARRVAASLLHGMQQAEPLWLRPVTLSDAETLLSWQQELATRRYARNPAVPSLVEHMTWLRRRLADPDCIFHIIMLGSEPTGSVRCDRMDDGHGWEVSINIAAQYQGRGLARLALVMQRTVIPDGRFMAFVMPENAASISLFRSAGYAPATTTGWWELSQSTG